MNGDWESLHDWGSLRDWLEANLRELRLAHHLAIEEREPVPPDLQVLSKEERSLVNRLLRIRQRPLHRSAEFSFMDPYLFCELVGAAAHGGALVVSFETDRRLRDLGWLAPDDDGYDTIHGTTKGWFPHYRFIRTRRGIPAITDATIAGLQLIGVDPAAIQVCEINNEAGLTFGRKH